MSAHRAGLRRSLPAFIAAAILLGVAIPASASPVDDKRAQAARLSAEIEANGSKISAAAEAYNAAQLKLGNTQAEINRAQAALDADGAQTKELQHALAGRAATMYMQAAGGGSTPTPSDFTSEQAAERYAASVSSSDEKVVGQLADNMERLNTEKQHLAAVKAQAVGERDAAEKRRRDVQALNARAQQLLTQVKGELAQLIEQQQREALAAASRRSGAVARGSTDFPANLPPASPRAAQAIAFARAQLGKPYQYAATGPDSYDCSGLTMRAWGAAGVSMPHFSGAQYDAFPHVPLDRLEPGDLVFYGPGGGHHVAMYLGSGLMIEAPHTGAFVRVVPLRAPMGAARPG